MLATRYWGQNIYPGLFPSDSHGPSGRGPVSSHPGCTSDRQVYVHEEESEYASEGNSSRVSKTQVKSRRPHAAARGCTVASARQQRILHCTHMWHHIARILLTVRIARGAVSFLATYEASDVGGDVPPPKVRRATGTHARRSWIRCIHGDWWPAHLLVSCLALDLWHDSFDGSGSRGLHTWGKEDIIVDRSGYSPLLRKAMRN